jgi:ferritin-like metal-binding protein YciE
MALDTLHDLLIEELKDLYSAENQLLKAIPKMVKAATHDELKEAFSEHLEVTRGQVARLEAIFKELEENPKGKSCKAMEGLVKEASELNEEDGNENVKDAALIAAAQRVEHYEIAGYGCVRTFANLLGLEGIASKLQETLDEEGEADKSLTKLAESIINVDADDEDEESEEDDDEDETIEAEEEELPVSRPKSRPKAATK